MGASRVAGPTLQQLAHALSTGKITSRALIEACLQKIAQADGEGARTFLHIDADAALAAADRIDGQRRSGHTMSPWAGIPISVKDNFDIHGQVTSAGSLALRTRQPATKDARAVMRLKRAGFVVLGRTNMTEFAYSGLGVNPHHGTPRNPWRRDVGYAPGGSSSGAAVSVADGMAHAALGTDTGGSCRIPAAFTGLVGYKPTRKPAMLDGSIPLAPSLDTAGVLGRSVDCCAALGCALHGPTSAPHDRARAMEVLYVPQTLVLDTLDGSVAAAFERTLTHLSRAGLRLVDLPLREFARMPEINASGGLPAAESFHWHRPLLAQAHALYDPRVLRRIERGRSQTAADYQDLLQARAWMRKRMRRLLGRSRALIMPTVAIAPPLLSDLEDEVKHQQANTLALRNCALVNFFDGCAISLPMHAPGEAPAGVMIACAQGNDAALLRLAQHAEELLGRK